jgi:hypothetical protein
VTTLQRAASLAPEHRNAVRYLENALLRRARQHLTEKRPSAARDDLLLARPLARDKHAEVLAELEHAQALLSRQALLAEATQAAARAAFGGGGYLPFAPASSGSAATKRRQNSDAANASEGSDDDVATAVDDDSQSQARDQKSRHHHKHKHKHKHKRSRHM